MMFIPDILDRLLDPLGQAMTPEFASRVIAIRADPQVQQRVDYLADRCNEGLLTPSEREEYQDIVAAGQMIAILQAKAKRILGTPKT
jgi:hypothetical protein